jgi:hypothetical protein
MYGFILHFLSNLEAASFWAVLRQKFCKALDDDSDGKDKIMDFEFGQDDFFRSQYARAERFKSDI